jgi:NAD+ diphosphatase
MDRPRQLPLAGGTHDRAALRRRDEDWLAQARRAASTRIIAVRSHSDLLIAEGSRLGHFAELPDDAEVVFLGIDESGAALFVYDADAAEVGPLHDFQELRTVGAALSAGDAALAAQAVALIGWHRRHRFCGVCGGPTLSEEAGHSRRCSQCGTPHFPRTDPAVIMIVTCGDSCVLSRRSGSAPNRWTVLSGFVEPAETPEEAVVREVYEEVGLRITGLRYFGAQPWPFPASLMLGYEAEAEYGQLVVDDELEDARWWDREELRQAIDSGQVAFPPSISISQRLIRAFLGEEV